MRINNIDTTTTRKRVVFCIIFAAICFAIPFWTFCCELSRLPLSIGELAAFFYFSDRTFGILELSSHQCMLLLLGSAILLILAFIFEIIRTFFSFTTRHPDKLKYIELGKNGVLFVFFDSNFNFFSPYKEISGIEMEINIDIHTIKVTTISDSTPDIYICSDRFSLTFYIGQEIKLHLTNTIAFVPQLYIEKVISYCSKANNFKRTIVYSG